MRKVYFMSMTFLFIKQGHLLAVQHFVTASFPAFLFPDAAIFQRVLPASCGFPSEKQYIGGSTDK